MFSIVNTAPLSIRDPLDKMPVRQKTVLVTGCSAGGIGAAVCEEFLSKGYHVFATARTTSKIPKSLTEAANVTVMRLDVMVSSDIAAAVEHVSKMTDGHLDVLVNNSGSGAAMPALDMSIGEARKLMDLNLLSVLEMIQAFSPLLLKSGGYIVNLGSIAGVIRNVYMSIYGASKAALMVASETWRFELKPFGIKVLTVVTGVVETNFHANFEEPKLPKGSHYHAIADFIHEKAVSHRAPSVMPVKDYAQQLVAYIERGTTGKIWLGGSTSLVKFSMTYLPEWVLDWLTERLNPVSKTLADSWKNTTV